MTASWPIEWPTNVDLTSVDAAVKALAEDFAAQTLRMLTLGRVGGAPVTVMPCGRRWPVGGNLALAYGYYPALWDTGLMTSCYQGGGCGWLNNKRVKLIAPVGRIDAVTIKGTALPSTAYRVEDGDTLVRLDGEEWPVCGAGDDFTVTYLNAFPVNDTGKYVGGILAAEYLKSMTGGKNCRLPSNVSMVSRQGITMQLQTGLFPSGMTGIREVDVFISAWNPNALKTRPGVYSPDLKRRQRQITGQW